MSCEYITESRKLYQAWRRGKKSLQTMTHDELIMIDEYVQLLHCCNVSSLPAVSSRRLRFPIPKKVVFLAIFILVFILILR